MAICLLIALALLIPAGAARAQATIKAEAWAANLSEIDGGNLGGAAGIGYDFGACRIEAEASRHMHLGNGTFALTAMGYCGPWTFGRFTPWAGAGLGSTGSGMVLQGAAGVDIRLTATAALTAGVVKRCYDKRCESRDNAAAAGIRVTF